MAADNQQANHSAQLPAKVRATAERFSLLMVEISGAELSAAVTRYAIDAAQRAAQKDSGLFDGNNLSDKVRSLAFLRVTTFVHKWQLEVWPKELA